MNINERLNKLRPYVLGFRFSETSPLIDCYFKDFWNISDSEEIFFAKTDTENQYICYSTNPSITIDHLLDFIDSLIKYNLDEESKVMLFKEKMQELKTIFESNDLKTLQSLKISLNDNKVPQSLNLDMNIQIEKTPPTHSFEKPAPIQSQPSLNNTNGHIKPVCRCVGNERCSVCLGIDDYEE